MKECWAEGDLRAYLDGELPSGESARVKAHLEVCSECTHRYSELAERAARVGEWMAVLTEPASEPVVLRPRHTFQYVAAGLALAAGLAIGFVMLPKREKEPERAAPPVAEAPAPARQPAVAMAEVQAPQRPRIRRPATRASYYLSLDNEPIETGTVMRVGVANGGLQAELILGPDGRAHAIRMVNVR
jgi:anti-sigma factor RsiW